jgi:hypothetical protein
VNRARTKDATRSGEEGQAVSLSMSLAVSLAMSLATNGKTA